MSKDREIFDGKFDFNYSGNSKRKIFRWRIKPGEDIYCIYKISRTFFDRLCKFTHHLKTFHSTPCYLFLACFQAIFKKTSVNKTIKAPWNCLERKPNIGNLLCILSFEKSTIVRNSHRTLYWRFNGKFRFTTSVPQKRRLIEIYLRGIFIDGVHDL